MNKLFIVMCITLPQRKDEDAVLFMVLINSRRGKARGIH